MRWHVAEEVTGDTGLAYDSNNGVADLAAVLRQVIADPGLADRLRTAARHRVATVYSWDRIIDDYERLFVELLGRAAECRRSSRQE